MHQCENIKIKLITIINKDEYSWLILVNSNSTVTIVRCVLAIRRFEPLYANIVIGNTGVILFLCFSVLWALRLPRLEKRELILELFVRLFDLCLFEFVCFLFRLVSGKGCGLWLWNSLDFSFTDFVQPSFSKSNTVVCAEFTFNQVEFWQ